MRERKREWGAGSREREIKKPLKMFIIDSVTQFSRKVSLYFLSMVVLQKLKNSICSITSLKYNPILEPSKNCSEMVIYNICSAFESCFD